MFFNYNIFASSQNSLSSIDDINKIMRQEYIELCKKDQSFNPNSYLDYLNQGIKKSSLSESNLWSEKIKHFLTKGIIGAIKLKFVKYDGSDNHKNILSTIDESLIASQKIDLINIDDKKKSFKKDFIFSNAAIALDDLSDDISSFLSVDKQNNDSNPQKQAYQSHIKRLTTVAVATERYLWNTKAKKDTLRFLTKSKLKEAQYQLMQDQLFDSDYIDSLIQDDLIEKIKSIKYDWFGDLVEKMLKKQPATQDYEGSGKLVHYRSSGHNNQCGFFSSFCKDLPLEINKILGVMESDIKVSSKDIEQIKNNLMKDKKSSIERIKKLLNNEKLQFQHKKDLQTILGILIASPEIYDARSEYINLVNDLDDEFIRKFVLAYAGEGLAKVSWYLDILNQKYKRSDFDEKIYDELREKEKAELEKIEKQKNKVSDDIRAKYGLLPDDSIPDVNALNIFACNETAYDGKAKILNIDEVIKRFYNAQKFFPYINKIIESDEGKKLGISDQVKQFGQKVTEAIDSLNQTLRENSFPEIKDPKQDLGKAFFQKLDSNEDLKKKLNDSLEKNYKKFFDDLYLEISQKYENFVQKIIVELGVKKQEYDHFYYDTAKPRLDYMLENNQAFRDFLINDIKKKIIEHFKHNSYSAELTLSPSKVIRNIYDVIEPFSAYCHRNQVNIKAFKGKNEVWMESITGKDDSGDIFYINNSGVHYEKLVKPLDEKQKSWDNLWQHAESVRQILMY